METKDLEEMYKKLAENYDVPKEIYTAGFTPEQIYVQTTDLTLKVLEKAEKFLNEHKSVNKEKKCQEEKDYDSMSAKEVLNFLDASCTDEETEEEINSDYLIEQK